MSFVSSRTWSGLLLCTALLGTQMAAAQSESATPAAAPSAQDGMKLTPGDSRDGTIKTVRGDVTVLRQNTRMAAMVGAGLGSTDCIFTGPNSAAAVTLKDGTVLSVGPDSMVDLKEFKFDSTTQEGNVLVNLARGTLRMATGLIAKAKPQNVKVTTPTTVVGVRGTDFIVEANP